MFESFLTQFAGVLGRSRGAWLKNMLIRAFIRHYRIDLSIAETEDPTVFETFNQFFTRRLKPGARPIDSDPTSIISAVDGRVSQIGKIEGSTLLQAKGMTYDLSALLAGRWVERFREGNFVTLYLSPRDYHRIHMPIDGVLEEMTVVPGRLFSVAAPLVRKIPGLFARNERVIAHFQTPIGSMAVIFVGAMIVGSIHTVWSGASRAKKEPQTVSYRDAPLRFKKGDLIGYFELGSTVIVLFERDAVLWEPELKPKTSVKMGQKVGETV